MGPDLGDSPGVEEHDAVGAAGGLQAVGDHDRGAVGGEALHRGDDAGLVGEVEVRGRLVEQQDRRVDQLRPGERDQLALPRRERAAALGHLVAVAAGQRGDEVVGADRAGRRLDLGVCRLRPSVGDVVADAPVKRNASCGT